MTEKHNNDTRDAKKTRFNPLDSNNFAGHVDLLKMAADIHLLKPNREYWETVPVPRRPTGRVRFEGLRQLATFALPALAYAGASAVVGWKGALLALPLYWGIGYLLDHSLAASIKAQRAKDEDLDRGRYAFTKILGERFGLEPHEVTLELVAKMNEELLKRHKWMKEVWPTHPDNPRNKPNANKAEAGNGGAGGSGGSNVGNTGNGGFASSGGHSSYDEDDAFDHSTHGNGLPHIELPSPWSGVNPNSGLPMIDNTPIDIHGNTWGTSGFGGF
ncbi:hypothetical protein OKW30_003552 [Paraburkholderia sp. Clong3]|uniref:hypothetical protein n=1 Tax=Paraburkholderia sp. Clong3 TaxID=2991061 RepID=UPI003D1A5A8F